MNGSLRDLNSDLAPASNGGAALKVAIVDDDPLFREALRLNLEDEGYRVAEFADGSAVVNYAALDKDFDLILLDWKMPAMDGIEVLRVLRGRGVKTPVIFLTLLSDEVYEEAALAGGAVDFVDKSRSFSILLRRIEVIRLGVKKPDLPVDAVSDIGALSLKLATKRAEWRGRAVELTVREFDIVAALAARAGVDMKYRDIYDTVHGHGFHAGDGEEGLRATVRAIIKRIRGKFRAVDPDFDHIETFAGFGYRWRP